MSTLQLVAEGVCKSFGSNLVLQQVGLTLKRGTIHALVGENGAGKSTLMKIFAGIHHKDAGTINVEGTTMELGTPKKAQDAGIMLMHQELSLFGEMTVAENIFSGHLPQKYGLVVDSRLMYQRAEEIIRRLECDFGARTQVKKLSVANQHLCEFARFLSMNSRYIILDEPTASLTEREKGILFRTIRQLRDQYQLGILYISHRMHEIFEIADEVSVLRDGVMQGTFAIHEVDEDQLTKLMIGYELQRVSREKFDPSCRGKVILQVAQLTCPGLFDRVSFRLHAGEILGMAGLLGARRKEIADSIFGLLRTSAGNIYLDGEDVTNQSVKQAILAGIALIPDERKEQGLVLGMSCQENTTLAKLDKVSSLGFISRRQERRVYEEFQKTLNIRSHHAEQMVKELSGGNQQKVILAKWLFSDPGLLILNEPTRGIDVGAKAEIYKLIRRLAQQGYGILLITSDMYELLTLSSRVIAVYNGCISAEFDHEQMNEDAIIAAISRNLSQEVV